MFPQISDRQPIRELSRLMRRSLSPLDCRSVLFDAQHLITASGKRERETGEPEGDREAKRGKMGARQSRRSVDITTTPKKEGLPAEGGVGDAAAPGDGKLERIEETDTKPTTNGIAPHTDVAEDKDKDKDDATEKDKDKEKVRYVRNIDALFFTYRDESKIVIRRRRAATVETVRTCIFGGTFLYDQRTYLFSMTHIAGL